MAVVHRQDQGEALRVVEGLVDLGAAGGVRADQDGVLLGCLAPAVPAVPAALLPPAVVTVI